MVNRSMPHNKEIEAGTITAIITGKGGAALEVLEPDDFYVTSFSEAFKAIQKIDNDGHKITRANLLHELSTIGGEENWDSLIMGLIENQSHHSIDDSIRILKDNSTRRKVYMICQQVIGSVHRQDFSLEEFESLIYSIREQNTTSEIHSVDSLVIDVMKLAERAKIGDVRSISTGFRTIDRSIPGLDPGDFVVLAGRPSMGKTALAVSIMANVAKTVPVLFFSLEMSRIQVTQRLMAIESNENLLNFRTGQFTNAGWSKCAAVSGDVGRSMLYIDDSSTQTIQSIRSKIRRTLSTMPLLGLVVIDYLQLMDGKGDNRQQEITAISRGLKGIAKDFSIPVVALSQLSRKVEERSDKRPLMSDLRESGAIEQDADIVLFVYREYYYSRDDDDKFKASVLIGKQRNGPVDIDIDMEFVPHCAKFKDPGESW